MLIGDLSVWSDIRAFPPLAVWGGVHCVAVMLLARRLTDATSLKLTSTQLCVTATIAALMVIAARAMLARVESLPPARWLRLIAAFASAAPIATLFFGSGRRLSLGTCTYLGLVIWVVGVAVWLWNREFIERLLTSFLLPPPGSPLVSGPAPLSRPAVNREHESERRGPFETLRLTRTAAPDGSDRLDGVMTAEFANGQVATTLHIPFLPTFPLAPELVCDVDKQAAVRIKGTAVYPYGCRIELKRFGDVSASIRVEVRFSATSRSSSSHAA